ncbi:hypothetical protein BJV77DRAFT_1103554 [Russula vinacea]|nr:hypothetical protein BJV77DRAFT_1103554 [Russula vinacea]
MTPLSGGLFLALQLPAFLIRLNPALYISARLKKTRCKLLPTFSTLPVNNGAKEMTKLAAVIQFLGEGDLQDVYSSRISTQPQSYNRWFYSTAPSKAERSDKGSHQTNLAVIRQLHKQVNEENALQKSVIIMQRNSAHFEGIVSAIQSAWQTSDEWQLACLLLSGPRRSLGHSYGQHPPDHEWISFRPALITSSTQINLFGIMRPSTTQARRRLSRSAFGYLERKTRFTRAYCENYFSSPRPVFCTSTVHLTRTGDLATFSLFLPSNGGMIYACSACGISSRDGPRPLGNLSEEEEDEEEEEEAVSKKNDMRR